MEGCGKPFDNGNWICGDFLEMEVDEEGRSLGKRFFCPDCHKKEEEKEKMRGAKILK